MFKKLGIRLKQISVSLLSSCSKNVPTAGSFIQHKQFDAQDNVNETVTSDVIIPISSKLLDLDKFLPINHTQKTLHKSLVNVVNYKKRHIRNSLKHKAKNNNIILDGVSLLDDFYILKTPTKKNSNINNEKTNKNPSKSKPKVIESTNTVSRNSKNQITNQSNFECKDKVSAQIISKKNNTNLQNKVIPNSNKSLKTKGNLQDTNTVDRNITNIDLIRVVDLNVIFTNNFGLIASIKEILPITEFEYQEYITPTLNNTAQYIYLLPASEAYHHEGVGGLFRHSLECAQLALQELTREYVNFDTSPLEKIEYRKVFALSVFIGGLLHDIGKVLADVEVYLPNKSIYWQPTAMGLYDFLTKNKVSEFSIRYRVGRGKRHEAFAQLLVSKILPTKLIDYLLKTPQILEELYSSLNADKSSKLYAIIKKADMRSVELELSGASLPDIVYRRRPNGVQRSILLLQELIGSSETVFNNAKGFIFLIGKKCFLAFNTYQFLEFIRPLKKAGIALSFSDNISFYEMLINLGIACYAKANAGIILQSFLVLENNVLLEHYGVEITNKEYLFAKALAPASLPEIDNHIYQAYKILKKNQKDDTTPIELQSCETYLAKNPNILVNENSDNTQKLVPSLSVPQSEEITTKKLLSANTLEIKEENFIDNPLRLPLDSPLRARDENGRFIKLNKDSAKNTNTLTLENNDSVDKEIEGDFSKDKNKSSLNRIDELQKLHIANSLTNNGSNSLANNSVDNDCSDYLKSKLARIEAAKNYKEGKNSHASDTNTNKSINKYNNQQHNKQESVSTMEKSNRNTNLADKSELSYAQVLSRPPLSLRTKNKTLKE